MNLFNENIGRTEKGFIDKNEILKYVTEEDIFELVFGFKPKEYDYVTSPFRIDEKPGCWFQYSISGKLGFIDFGSKIYLKNQKMIRMDCFDAVQQYFKLPNLYRTLRFIKEHLIDGKNLPEISSVKLSKKVGKNKIDILFTPKIYTIEDRKFWFDKYQIYKENLIEDKVFPITQYKALNTKFGNYSVTTKSISYCYTDFESGNKKIYRPLEKMRFFTNCNQNDIGGINSLPNRGKLLVITKSYKDYRVLKNQGLTVIWFQNEGMYPTLDILLPLCNRFENISVFFDNDKTGIEASIKLVSIINSYIPGKAFNTYLSENLIQEQITDPSDFIYKKGREQLIQFLIHKNLI